MLGEGAPKHLLGACNRRIVTGTGNGRGDRSGMLDAANMSGHRPRVSLARTARHAAPLQLAQSDAGVALTHERSAAFRVQELYKAGHIATFIIPIRSEKGVPLQGGGFHELRMDNKS